MTSSVIKENVPMLLMGIVLPFYIAAKMESGNYDLLSFPTNWTPKLDLYVSVVYIAWLLGQWILYMLDVGDVIPGPVLRQGKRLNYRLNGFFALVVNIIVFLFATLCGFRVAVIFEKITELVTIACLIQFLISFILLCTQKTENLPIYNINPVGNRGNILEDWLVGRSISPRLGFLDLKFVFARTGMIALAFFNFSVMAKYYEDNKTTNYTLLLAIGMALVYTADNLYHESFIVYIREMSREGCGITLLVYVIGIPIEYGLVVSYVATTKHELPLYCLLLIAVIFLLGYWTYRSSNNEKSHYRANPDDPIFKKYETITTASDKHLLVSGWWGMSRHPNYLGDIVMHVAMSFAAGFTNFLPHLNATLITSMLLHRERMDCDECKDKYGEDWEKYCHRVKWRVIPYIY
ncbi:delta(14)-sterol reductase TM7SF2-like [Mytilus californianus]|uniref:delta(14)-sterol reductase TM7SF2-like n=1 Tax=Mytilus californianus TaxID=6549 RepID=UPI002247BEF9|nr:delta(14)-sterol reductase TM7SF2-like [Mytilus californianus]